MTQLLSVLLTDLRIMLRDPTGGPPPVWSDDELTRCVMEAVELHSYAFPLQATILRDVDAADLAFPLLDAAEGETDILAVQRVELPTGTPLPEDPRQEQDPANSSPGYHVGATAQAWWVASGYLNLRNAPSGAEIGTDTLSIQVLRTYTRPDTADTIPWNGPATDEEFLLLLARRAAWTLFAGWFAAGLVVAGAGADLASLTSLVDGLNVEVETQLTIRRKRNVRSRPLDL